MQPKQILQKMVFRFTEDCRIDVAHRLQDAGLPHEAVESEHPVEFEFCVVLAEEVG